MRRTAASTSKLTGPAQHGPSQSGMKRGASSLGAASWSSQQLVTGNEGGGSVIRPVLSLPGVRFALLFGVLVVSVAVPSTAFADGQAIVNAAASQAGKPYCWTAATSMGLHMERAAVDAPAAPSASTVPGSQFMPCTREPAFRGCPMMGRAIDGLRKGFGSTISLSCSLEISCSSAAVSRALSTRQSTPVGV